MITHSILHRTFLKALYFLLLFLTSQFVVAEVPANFTKAKQLAKQIYANHRVTFYCGCQYDKHGMVNLKSCGYKIQKDKRRARRLEWEHIVPASHWGQQLPCWREAQCCNAKKCYKGRSCCRKMDKKFSMMESDLHNLVPEIGELNAIRSNYRFGVLPEVKQGEFGNCQFKIDKTLRRVEPCDAVKGMIARAYFYMEHQYAIQLSQNQRQLFLAWNQQFPPSTWEIEWDQKIKVVQGNHNPFISEYKRTKK